MPKIRLTKQFKKDYAKAAKRGKSLVKIKKVLLLLEEGEALPKKYKDHSLTGNYVNSRDCHIEPDWLLIYNINGDTITLERTGSHSDLFKK